jgi:hypothetical protein
MRAATIVLLVGMLAISSVAFSGTTKPDEPAGKPPAHSTGAR